MANFEHKIDGNALVVTVNLTRASVNESAELKSIFNENIAESTLTSLEKLFKTSLATFAVCSKILLWL